MPEFLTLVPPREALSRVLQQLPVVIVSVEEIDTVQAYGRVLARDMRSPESLPAFSRSTVDGYAVRATDTHGASDSLPAYFSVVGEVPMGGQPMFSIGKTQAGLIHTGGMLPEGADAVVMIEHTQESRSGEMELFRPVGRYENVIRTGEDVSVDQVVLPAGKRLLPADIGGLMALGFTRVQVAHPPRVAILSTGDEVVSPERRPSPGQVRDINSYSLAALVQQAGGSPHRFGIIPDDAGSLEQALANALSQADMVVITAGSSASSRDLTARVIQQAGQPGVLVHGINLRPGKPTILAVCNGKPVIGLPGNPVSALVVARLFVIPLVERMLGLSVDLVRPHVTARLTTNLVSQAGREEWFPARLQKEPDGLHAEPIFYKSNLIFTLARADGLIYLPAAATGLSSGEEVQVYFL